MLPADVRPLLDVSPGHWLVERLPTLGPRVREVVPAGYEAYAEVPNEPGLLWPVRDVVAGHTATPQRCWFTIWEGWPLPDAWLTAPRLSLPHREHLLFAGSLDDLDVIAVELGCAVLDKGGQGVSLRVGRAGRPTPEQWAAVATAARAERQHQWPSLWWPEDRAWVVGSEVDSDATYVAGTGALVAEVVARLAGAGARQVSPDDLQVPDH